MYCYDSSFAFPVKRTDGAVDNVRAYDVELLIRNASDGKKYLYDIVSIKESTAVTFDLLKQETRKGGHKAASRGGTFAKSISQDGGNVNRRFSLKEDSQG